MTVSGQLAFASISAGVQHTCGVTTDGSAYCWGGNSVGQLGIGNIGGPSQTSGQAYADIPYQVVGNIKFSTVTAGYWSTCGIATDGTAYCWGKNDTGQLGNRSAGTLSSVPMPVSTMNKFIAIGLSIYYACGLTTDGSMYCWGSNGTYGFGTGTLASSATPTLAAGGMHFSSMAVGDGFTCGVASDGTYCWGINDSGESGTGISGTYTTSPTRVAGTQQFVRVNANATSTSVCGMTGTGAVYCWGADFDGRLGNGSTVSPGVGSPQAVVGGISFAAVTGGGDHSCALTSAGAMYCWGNNTTGQLGLGNTNSPVSAPALVNGGSITFKLP